MYLCLDQQTTLTQYSVATFRRGIEDSRFTGLLTHYWAVLCLVCCLWWQLSVAFCWCCPSILWGHPQRKLVYDLRCQLVISLWVRVDSLGWSVTCWFSCVGYFYKGQTLALRMLHNCLENFLTVGLRSPTSLNSPSFWHKNSALSCPSSLLFKLQIQFRLFFGIT